MMLREWALEGRQGMDIGPALRGSPLLRAKALEGLDTGELAYTPVERLTALITGLAGCPGTAAPMMKLIDEDKMPMYALTGEAFYLMNRQSEDKM